MMNSFNFCLSHSTWNEEKIVRPVKFVYFDVEKFLPAKFENFAQTTLCVHFFHFSLLFLEILFVQRSFGEMRWRFKELNEFRAEKMCFFKGFIKNVKISKMFRSFWSFACINLKKNIFSVKLNILLLTKI